MSRDEFDSLLEAMVRAGLIDIEEATFEKDKEVIRFRKVRLTDSGLEMRSSTPVELLLSDGVVKEFGGQSSTPSRAKKAKSTAKDSASVSLSAKGEALAARLKQWRAAEAKRLGLPAYMVLNDRTLAAVAQARPANPRELLEISGMGPAKVERFGQAILELCGAAK
jgi:superfamily II DNA helicase RecQ